MTRIRYNKTGDTLTSKQQFQHPTNGARYQVVINESQKTYSVVDTMAEMLVVQGEATNLHLVKIAAKKALMELGISFEAEGRAKDLPATENFN